MDFQKVFGASPAVQLIDVLSDDHDPSALLVQPGLTFSNGKVPRVRLLAQHDLPPVVVELPHQGRVSCKGLRGGQILGVGGREEAGVRERRPGCTNALGHRSRQLLEGTSWNVAARGPRGVTDAGQGPGASLSPRPGTNEGPRGNQL